MSGPAVEIRRAAPEDLPSIARIQAACPEASQWEPDSYLSGDCRVATIEGRVAGFLALRSVTSMEHEVLNIGVAPRHRRRGVAKLLIKNALDELKGDVFLEVRESNQAARTLYEELGFQSVGCRKDYYKTPRDNAVVMRFQSC